MTSRWSPAARRALGWKRSVGPLTILEDLCMPLFRRAAALAAVSAAVLAAACGEDTATDPNPVPSVQADVALSLVPLDVYGLGAAAHGCGGARNRQFDFWLGRWDVFTGATLVGTNEVKSRVDGCVVEENWTSASLGRG